MPNPYQPPADGPAAIDSAPVDLCNEYMMLNPGVASQPIEPSRVSIDEIIEKVTAYNPQAPVDVLRRAYDVSAKAHDGQMRKSGEPYVMHPLAVAEILTTLRMDVPSIVAGLLHDTVEDTLMPRETIEQQFGPDVLKLVDGVTKIGKIRFKSYEEKQAENFRKMILSMAEDIRVVLIKLADRLHNMRTLSVLRPDKQERIARETLEIYAPLANRLGIAWMKNELEDLCFKYLRSDAYQTLVAKVAKQLAERQRYVDSVIEKLKAAMAEYGFTGTVYGRPKHFYGIYSKMERREIPFEEVYDLIGIRIITDTKIACYGILGMIHSLWKPVPGRFKDYIGVPKSNLYQSLHTTVIGPQGEHVEFQIRTEEMHRIAEEGIAAHWRYKDQGQIDEKDNRLFAWLRQLVEWQKDLADNRQFLNSIKMDLFTDVIYAFTPKGDVIELVKGATPIDLAYAVHTEVGHHCTGAKINGKLAPLKSVIKSGDTVEILTSPTQVPSKDWLKLAKTPKAKTRIKHWIKLEEHKQSLDIGRKLLERELRRHHLSPNEVFKSDTLNAIASDSGLASVDDLLVALSYGRVSINHVINRLLPESALKEGLTDKLLTTIGKQPRGVTIKGINDIMINLAKCCNPVPGDKILGFITRGRGLSIHTADCPNVDELDYDRDRIVEVDWDVKDVATHPVKVSVITQDRPGMLAKISSAISAGDANISHAEVTTTDEKKAVFHFVVEVRDTNHLDKVFKGIEAVDGVLQCRRTRRG
jgi:GTP pyrophosphokinase